MTYAEQIIKAELDGNFWYVDRETFKVVRRDVPKDYTPSFKSAPIYVPPKQGHPKRRVWSAQEDEMILELRLRKTSWYDVQKVLHRGITQLRDRYKELCIERGLVPDIGRPQRAYLSWPEELKNDILRFRRSNMPLRAVARKAGVSAFMIRDFLGDCAPDLLEVSINGMRRREADQNRGAMR